MVVDDLLKKAQNGVHIVDPINDDPKELVLQLKKMRPITYPSEDNKFNFSIGDKSLSALQE